VRQYVARQNVAEKSLWAGPTQKKVNMQIVAEKSLWAGPTGEKKKQKIILSRYKLSQRRACGRDPPGKKEKNKSLRLVLVA
jgi:hypothetical protein